MNGWAKKKQKQERKEWSRIGICFQTDDHLFADLWSDRLQGKRSITCRQSKNICILWGVSILDKYISVFLLTDCLYCFSMSTYSSAEGALKSPYTHSHKLYTLHMDCSLVAELAIVCKMRPNWDTRTVHSVSFIRQTHIWAAISAEHKFTGRWSSLLSEIFPDLCFTQGEQRVAKWPRMQFRKPGFRLKPSSEVSVDYRWLL